jgi:hypothetical protein
MLGVENVDRTQPGCTPYVLTYVSDEIALDTSSTVSELDMDVDPQPMEHADAAAARSAERVRARRKECDPVGTVRYSIVSDIALGSLLPG